MAAVAAGAVGGAAAVLLTTSFVKWLQARRQSSKHGTVCGDARVSDSAPGSEEAKDIDPELLEEQFSRNTQFFGARGQKQISESYIIVVGAGGVGSHAAAALARAGVGKLKIIDFDRVTLSSLNRHAVAGYSDVGTPKTDALRRHIHSFNRACNVDSVPVMFTGDAAEELISGEAAQPHCMLWK